MRSFRFVILLIAKDANAARPPVRHEELRPYDGSVVTTWSDVRNAVLTLPVWLLGRTATEDGDTQRMES